MTTISEETVLHLPERIRHASRRPKTLGAAVPGAVSLAMGEPDGDTPAPVVDAAIKALQAGRTRYAQITGSADLRRELAAHVSTMTGRALEAANIVVTHGGSGGLAAAVLAVVGPGDRVLVPEPTYSLYADQLAMVGARTEWVANRPDGSLDLDRLAATAPGARMIILCNPANPTGAVFGAEQLAGLAHILRTNPDLFLLSDEAYSDIVFDGLRFQSAITLEESIDRVVLAGTFSKSYAMTGWRLGYVAAAPEIAASINLVHRTINGAMNTFIQDAALAALRIPNSDLRERTHGYERRRDLVLRHLEGFDRLTLVRPEGAFYAFPHIDSTLSSDELTRRFADGGVLVRAGSEFGPSGEGHVRLSFATDDASLEEGLRRFAGVIRHL